MRVLVTGGAGYIGSFTVRRLLEHRHEITVYDNLCAGHRRAVPEGLLEEGDIADIDRLDRIIVERQIEGVIHFAAFASVGESVTHPALYYRNNLSHSLALLEVVRKRGIGRFVFSSTAAVYGHPRQIPLTEADVRNPVNPYGHSKAAFEAALADYSAAYGIGTVALRYFNAAGAVADGLTGEDHTPETHLIPNCFLAALGKKPAVEIYGTDYPTPDGTCVRDFVHVEDLAEAHGLALGSIVPGTAEVYNVANGRGYSVREVIRTCESVSGRPVPWVEKSRRAGDPAILVASAEKIRNTLGWSPRYPDLQSIAATAWEWHRSRNGAGGV